MRALAVLLTGSLLLSGAPAMAQEKPGRPGGKDAPAAAKPGPKEEPAAVKPGPAEPPGAATPAPKGGPGADQPAPGAAPAAKDAPGAGGPPPGSPPPTPPPDSEPQILKIMGEMEVEMDRHRRLTIRLERVLRVVTDKGDTASVDKIKALTEKLEKQHQKVMERLERQNAQAAQRFHHALQYLDMFEGKDMNEVKK